MDILPNIFKMGSFMNDGGARSMKVEYPETKSME